jgi:hypothetical protein
MLIKQWDLNDINDGTNYEVMETASFYGLPQVSPILADRGKMWPVVSGIDRSAGRMIAIDILIRAGSSDELAGWFDYEDETPKGLLASDQDGSTNLRTLTGVCVGFAEIEDSGGQQYRAIIAISGDPYWNRFSERVQPWTVNTTPDTQAVSNDGDMDCWPRFEITPTSGKTGGYDYKVWIALKWLSETGATKYPTDITDNAWNTATLVSGAKMQADGDDLRVYVDGVEVDRWLDGINTTTTEVWVNLDFQPTAQATLGEQIAASGAITEIVSSDDISLFPSSGILFIDSEAFTYTSKSNSSKTFYGVTRASRGTSMALHTTTDTIYWIQHDIWIYYGNSGASAPDVDDDHKPVMTLNSTTNTSWVYAFFGEVDGLRSGSWVYQESVGNPSSYKYTANQDTDADPFQECGLYTEYDQRGPSLQWFLYNPCFITNANFTNGHKKANPKEAQSHYIAVKGSGSWIITYWIPDPTADDTWETWSRNESMSAADYTHVALGGSGTQPSWAEFSDCTITLNSSYTPDITIGSEQNNYSLDCELYNITTDEALEIKYTMNLNETLVIDCADKDVYDDEDNIKQFQALTVVGGPRLHWMTLAPGSNTIRYTETGVNTVNVSIYYRPRWYD